MTVREVKGAGQGIWSEVWEQILMTDVAFFRRLSVRSLDRIRPAIAHFIDEKEILGHGVEIDDRARLLVAAAACRLTLNIPAETYTRLRCVDVYATLFEDEGDGHRIEGNARLHRVSLAFDRLEAGLRGGSGENVGYHEFAHVLDTSDGLFDGVPPLLVDPSLHRSWTLVLEAELARVRAAVEAGEPTVISRHATASESELFAYATEVFFEAPTSLREAHPALYALLAKYYAQDPLAAAGRV